MHEYEVKTLDFLAGKSPASLDELQAGTGLAKDQAMWAAESLLKYGAVSVKRGASRSIQVSEEGRRYAKEFPEEALVRSLAKKKEKISNIRDQIGLSWAKRNGWITISNGEVSLTNEGAKLASGSKQYQLRELLGKLIDSGPEPPAGIADRYKDAIADLAKRKLVDMRERSQIESISITKAGALLLSKEPKERGIGVLTKEMIKNGAWHDKQFKPYDINAPTDVSYPARLHPVREFTNRIRQKWFEMGFIEVEGPIIESAFWNFDALFSPQDHPTREMQDTFYLSNPKQLTIEDVELIGKVKKMHIQGWKEDWNEQLARSAVLRTHTTSVSARYMKKLAKAVESGSPTKMFSIGSVFRNETMDYKHLAELRQYDGIIVGDNLTLSNLIHTLKSFYSRLGLDDVKLAPSYFPFTEPSLGFFYYDEAHGDIIELCGGGIIRKEITAAMGLNKTVLAWGGGVDRLLLNDKIFGVGTLPELYKNDIAWLRTRGGIKV